MKKSKQEQLITRGYLAKGVESKHTYVTWDEKIKLLQSNAPTDRTLGARLLGDTTNSETIHHLITALTNKPTSKILFIKQLFFEQKPRRIFS